MGRKKVKANAEPKGGAAKNEIDVDAASVESGGSASGQKLSGKEYDRELRKLHVELVKLQQWVVRSQVTVSPPESVHPAKAEFVPIDS